MASRWWPPCSAMPAWMLGTDDAHGLYAGFGFAPLEAPQKYMRRPAP